MKNLSGKIFDATVPTLTHVSDIYRKKLNQAENFRLMAKDAERTEIVRSNFHDRAFRLESQASNLAHCLAFFGNLTLTSIDIEKCMSEIEHMTCEESNPWARGLTLIKEVIAQSAIGQP